MRFWRFGELDSRSIAPIEKGSVNDLGASKIVAAALLAQITMGGIAIIVIMRFRCVIELGGRRFNIL